ncbi:MAG: DUF2339 domain-containing protein [Verrucomicrobiota bacterium]
MTTPQEDREVLKRRLESLESEISSIRDQLKHTEGTTSQVPPPLPDSIVPVKTQEAVLESPTPPPLPRSFQWKPEVWMGRIGICLLIFGLLFLFQHAVDEGWLGHWFRVSLGFILGAVLFLGALRTGSPQKWFRQLLFGGALATWYLTLYTASQIYGLVPGGLALIAALSFAVLAYFLSLRERSGTIAILATLGGMLSPLFLLEGTEISAVELLITIILSAMALSYYSCRGGSLQVLLVFLLGGVILVEAGEGPGSTGARFFIQVVWLLWGILLLAATFLRNHYMQTESFPARLRFLQPDQKLKKDSSEILALLMASLMPLILFLATSGIWNLPKPQAGWIALLLAAVAFVARQKLITARAREGFQSQLMDLLLFHSLLFGLAAIIMIMDGSLQLFCVSGIGFVMLQWSLRNRSKWFRALGNLLYAASLFWVAIRLNDAADGINYSLGLSIACWVDFLVIALSMIQCVLSWRKTEATIYWIFGMPMLLLWLNALVSGQEYAGPVLTMLWSGVALSLLTAGSIKNRRLWNVTGVILLLVVMFKLFLFDLANVDAVWRVSLFLLLGSVFLLTSYFISKIRSNQSRPGKRETVQKAVEPPKLPSSPSSDLEKPQEEGKMNAQA